MQKACRAGLFFSFFQYFYVIFNSSSNLEKKTVAYHFGGKQKFYFILASYRLWGSFLASCPAKSKKRAAKQKPDRHIGISWILRRW